MLGWPSQTSQAPQYLSFGVNNYTCQLAAQRWAPQSPESGTWSTSRGTVGRQKQFHGIQTAQQDTLKQSFKNDLPEWFRHPPLAVGTQPLPFSIHSYKNSLSHTHATWKICQQLLKVFLLYSAACSWLTGWNLLSVLWGFSLYLTILWYILQWVAVDYFLV